MNAREIDAALPGHPRRRLVVQVRRQLALFGIRPTREQWLATWQWARQIAVSYSRPMWPVASEIAAQYMVVLLAEMRQLSPNSLKLPYRASRFIPPELQALVSSGRLALPAPDDDDTEAA